MTSCCSMRVSVVVGASPTPLAGQDNHSAGQSSYLKDLLEHSPVAQSEQAEFRAWSRRFAQWLFGTDHIAVRYGIDYDGVDNRTALELRRSPRKKEAKFIEMTGLRPGFIQLHGLFAGKRIRAVGIPCRARAGRAFDRLCTYACCMRRRRGGDSRAGRPDGPHRRTAPRWAQTATSRTSRPSTGVHVRPHTSTSQRDRHGPGISPSSVSDLRRRPLAVDSDCRLR